MRMIDYEPKDGDYLPGEAFVRLARAVLLLRGTENFHDDWVEIRSNYNGNDLQITRCKQMVGDDHRRSHLGVSNPTTMVDKGDLIRHHGEHVYLTQHLRDLINPPPKTAADLTAVIRNWLDQSPATEWGAFEERLHNAIGGDE